MRRNHCVADSDSGHKPRIILGLPWSQSDSNNSPTFVRLVNSNPINSGSLSVTRKISNGSTRFCHLIICYVLGVIYKVRTFRAGRGGQAKSKLALMGEGGGSAVSVRTP